MLTNKANGIVHDKSESKHLPNQGVKMTKYRAAIVVWISVCALSVIQALYDYPQLPARIASHFGPNGQPDGWSGKEEFLIVYFVVVGVVIVLFAGLPALMSILPASLINLPNKDYWFAPERRQDTLETLRYYPLWFASATMLLVIDIMRQAFLVNIGPNKSLDHPKLSIALFFGFVIAWAIGFFLKFRKPEA